MMSEDIPQPPAAAVALHPTLFQLDFPNLPDRILPLYDVSEDDQRFAVLTGDRAKTTTITLLTNWPAELKK